MLNRTDTRPSVSNWTSKPSTSKNGGGTDSDELMLAILGTAIQFGLTVGGSYLLVKWLKKVLDADRDAQMGRTTNTAAQLRLERILKKRGKQMPPLSGYESMIAEDVVDPLQLKVSFQDIGGLDRIKQELWQLAILPLKRPDLFANNSLVQPPRGILLYGRPGTGKTMLAKALAKEAEAIFLEVKLSKIMDKWFGESNKLIAATFGLAQKLAPSIIFVDELDTFLNPRDGFENSASATIKSEFLVLWDGMTTQDGVLVLGATNRPHNVDKAILRRLPRTFEVPVPNKAGRKHILSILLKDQNMDGTARLFVGNELVMQTNGYSGSDLKELCRAAASAPIHEIVADATKNAVSGRMRRTDPFQGVDASKVRAIRKGDFIAALEKVKRTGLAAHEYGQEVERERHTEKAVSIPNQAETEAKLAALASVLSKSLLNNGGGGGSSDDSGDSGDVPNIP